MEGDKTRVVYYTDTGKVGRLSYPARGELPDVEDGLSVFDVTGRYSDADNYQVVEGELVEIDRSPGDALATSYQITAKWRQLEASAIRVPAGLMDCDPLSEARMQGTIDEWDNLPLQAGVFELSESGEKVVKWRTADNLDATVTKQELIAVFQQIKTARAQRSAKLFAEAQSKKNRTDTTVGEVASVAEWGISEFL